MLSISLGTWRFASTRARNDVMLKWSEPQNKIRNGPEVAGDLFRALYWRCGATSRERTEPGSLQSMVPELRTVGVRCRAI